MPGDEVAIVQIGGDRQDAFIGWAERELLPALRSFPVTFGLSDSGLFIRAVSP